MCSILFKPQCFNCLVFVAGLHCREREVRQVPATLWRTLCRQAFPQGPVPHCGASDQLHDDARPQQWQEADDRAHRQACLWDHPPADWRGMQLSFSIVMVLGLNKSTVGFIGCRVPTDPVSIFQKCFMLHFKAHSWIFVERATFWEKLWALPIIPSLKFKVHQRQFVSPNLKSSRWNNNHVIT